VNRSGQAHLPSTRPSFIRVFLAWTVWVALLFFIYNGGEDEQNAPPAQPPPQLRQGVVGAGRVARQEDSGHGHERAEGGKKVEGAGGVFHRDSQAVVLWEQKGAEAVGVCWQLWQSDEPNKIPGFG
jgi:hypothetical protein